MVHLPLLSALLLTHTTTAHFLLNYPPTIGFDDDLEATAPCGSFTVDFAKDNVSDFHVAGDSIALMSTHPEATWLFRATLDQNATGNWTALLPPVQQTGLGAYCEQDIMVPSEWAGSKGVIGVVQDAVDGLLYQCAAVNFVSGSTKAPSACTNATGASAKYTTDAKLSSLAATAAPTSSGSMTSGSMTITTTSGSTTSASTAGAAGTSSPTAKSGAQAIGTEGGMNLLVGWFVIAMGTVVAAGML